MNREAKFLSKSSALEQNLDFWTYIYDCCQRFETNESGNEVNQESVKLILGTIVESYDKHFDPVEKFHEYVLVLLCKSILENINK